MSVGMDSAYSESFARIYNLRWTFFASSLAPAIQAVYEKTPAASSNRRLLDVACGTGQLVGWFLQKGYTCTGLDLSPHMLAHAQKNNAAAVKEGRADFVCADASRFSLNRGYGLVVSTFDALNHLPDREHLSSCFLSVFQVLAPGGLFIFDLNTEKGLKLWNSMSVEETDELFILNRGIYGNGMERAYMRITGFSKTESGQYERFEQTAFNTVFSMRDVMEDLAAAGFKDAYTAAIKSLSTPVAAAEELTRAFFVAGKP
jgi:SAM-dependent methyltransferase